MSSESVVGTPRQIRETAKDRAFLFSVHVILVLSALLVILPLLYILSSSFSSPEAVTSGRVFLWPVDFSLEGYKVTFSTPQIVTGYGNSFFYAIAGTIISTSLTIMIAYPLSRRGFYGGGVLMGFVLFTMLFSGGLIPTYLVVKNLGLLNTRWALLLPNAIGVWQVIIARTYFKTAIPEELAEAAALDGCSDFRFLLSVVLPLAKPMLAVIALMYGIWQWNGFFDALIYLKDPKLYPLQLVLRNILILNTQGTVTDVSLQMQRQQLAELLKFALVVVATVPVLLVYPFVARHFTKGMLVGAVKG